MRICQLIWRIMLRGLGHDVETVPEENLGGADDGLIWQAAQMENRFLITQDLDFSSIHQFKPGTHHGVLLLRLKNPTRRRLIQRVETIFAYELVDEWPGSLIIVTDSKIRIRAAKE